MSRHETSAAIVSVASRVLTVALADGRGEVDHRDSSALRCVNVAAAAMARFDSDADVGGRVNGLVEVLIGVLSVSSEGTLSSPLVMGKLDQAARRYKAAIARLGTATA